MGQKILVADDSLTIQKVVSITLANTDFDIVQAHSEEELFEQLGKDQFDLVLLDFSLSETKEGFELAREVHSSNHSVPILAMLGTFDTVDDHKLKEAGIADKIIKPFESQKFIAKCTGLIGGSDLDRGEGANLFDNNSLKDIESEVETEEAEGSSEEEIGDDWVVDAPKIADEEQSDSSTQLEEPGLSSGNILAQEVEGWGMSVPGVIGQSGSGIVKMPPSIEEPSGENISSLNLGQVEKEEIEELDGSDEVTTEYKLTPSEEEQIFPDEDDLGFPEQVEELNLSPTKEELSGPVAKLVPLGELVEEEDESEDLDVTDPLFTLPTNDENFVEEEISPLADEINASISPEDFWAVDEEDTSQEVSEVEEEPELEDEQEIDYQEETISSLRNTFDQSDLKSGQEEVKVEDSRVETQESHPTQEIDTDKIVAEIMTKVEPLIRQLCQDKIEKIAWEVIPDLAENLIKGEIREISEKVQSEINQ
jgi:CheY-like chemotaxis protein